MKLEIIKSEEKTAIPPDLVAFVLCEDLSFISSMIFFEKNFLLNLKIKNEDKISVIKPRVILYLKLTLLLYA